MTKVDIPNRVPYIVGRTLQGFALQFTTTLLIKNKRADMPTITVDAGTNVEPDHRAHPGDTDEPVKVSAKVSFDAGDDLQEAVDMYGQDTVFERWKRQVKRDLGNAIRSALNNGRTPDQVEEELADWRPDVTRTGGAGSAQTLEEKFQELPEDARKEKLEKLMQIAQGE